jgi:phospholipase/carboxylesterase
MNDSLHKMTREVSLMSEGSKNTSALSGPATGPAKKSSPQQLFILLHGENSSGDNFIEYGEALSNALPEAVFTAPNAPFPFGNEPGKRLWFEIEGKSADAILDGIEKITPSLNDYIDDQIEKYGVQDHNVALIGFSQGAMLALHAGLRRKRRLGAIVSYSGMLIGPEILLRELASQPKVFFIHGKDDRSVPAERVMDSVTKLMELNVPAELRFCYGIGHAINKEGMIHGASFLGKTFNIQKKKPNLFSPILKWARNMGT